ncbi:MAG: hypothetical protein JW891_10980 [Candidatus Lokiarchaeota archaeon]|nr:hypothetical protein [Candidatus Lokiarchaeota archaeon]
MTEQEKKPKPKGKWQHENWVSILGKWTWVILLVNALVYILWPIVTIATTYSEWLSLKQLYDASYIPGIMPPYPAYPLDAYLIWEIIAAIILVIFAIAIVRPRFSKPCADKDWDKLLDDVLVLGSVRIPWMLIWGIITEILGQWWGGAPIFVVAFVLIFAGPKPYSWKT